MKPEDVPNLLTEAGAPSIGVGWYPIVAQLVECLEEQGFNRETDIIQIKEKFGGLRFYYNVDNLKEDMTYLVDYAERLSYTVCEGCGKRGEVTQVRGWYLTLCGECENERLRDGN